MIRERGVQSHFRVINHRLTINPNKNTQTHISSFSKKKYLRNFQLLATTFDAWLKILTTTCGIRCTFNLCFHFTNTSNVSNCYNFNPWRSNAQIHFACQIRNTNILVNFKVSTVQTSSVSLSATMNGRP